MLNCLCYSGAWCSGLTCGPVKAETAGSNPVAPAKKNLLLADFFLHRNFFNTNEFIVISFCKIIIHFLQMSKYLNKPFSSNIIPKFSNGLRFFKITIFKN